jgi:uncharacterized protein
MRMFIEAWARGVLQTDSCKWAAEKAIEFLEQVASEWQDLKSPAGKIVKPPTNSIVYSMWESVRLVGDPDLTPMASVAGAIAESTAELLWSRGMTRVVVNNGGDLAIRLGPGESLAVGIRPYVDRPDVTYRIVLTPELNIRGICTSGLGGRSFTRGIASAATVFAENAAISDASATAIANATLIASPAVKRIMAHSVDPDTDLKGVGITCSVGELTEGEIELALNQGVRRAEDLVEKALIIGACITIKGRMRCTEGISRLVAPL